MLKGGRDYIGVGGGALIINKKNEVLLLKRSQKSKNEAGYWNRPGGTLEFGEEVQAMVKREVREELGVEIEIIRFLGFTNHIIESEKQHWISLGFLAKIKHGEPINKEPDKHDEIGWFDLKKLPEKISKPTREGIKQYLSARIPSSFGF